VVVLAKSALAGQSESSPSQGDASASVA
jgi:hypothetical protein